MIYLTKPKVVKYRDVLNKPVGDLFNLNEKIEVEKLPSKSDTLFFRILLKAGDTLDRTRCNFIKEIVLYDGSIKELITNRTLKMYEKLTIKKGQTHAFYANEDSIVYLQLKKPY